MFFNRLCFSVGLLPFFPFIMGALYFGNAHIVLAPIIGFIPLDFFHFYTVPPPEQVRFWCWIAGVSAAAFAVLAFFKKPFGILFALTIWASTATLLTRIIIRLHHGPPLFE